jgi:citrate synthase
MSSGSSSDKRITAAEAATRLGVKRETLYAYVSRGLLTSERSADGRSSSFSADEVAAIAHRARRGGRAGALELIVASAITSIDDGRLAYRGLDATELAVTCSFEAVAEWLWTGDPEVFDRQPRWPVAPNPYRAPLPADPINRLRTVVAAMAAEDALRYDLETPAVTHAGRRILMGMVDGLTPIGAELSPQRRTPLAGTLWPRLAPGRPASGQVAVLNAALVLLADHELAVSTLAARVAASARADPYSVVSTGLGVIAGGMHGAASRPVVDLLTEVGRPAHAAQVIGARLRRGERLPGLGHKVYRTVDPRAEVLLDLLCGLRLPAGRWAVVVAVHDLVRDRLPLVVNVDFALGAMVYAAGMDVEAAEAMFSIARTAGWLAHAIEEYAEEPLRFRPRAAYTGPALAPTPPRRARPGTGVGVVRP